MRSDLASEQSQKPSAEADFVRDESVWGKNASANDAGWRSPIDSLRTGGFVVLLALAMAANGDTRGQTPTVPDSALVNRALAAELKAAQDAGHPMRYRLRKSTPRLTSIKEIVETRDGAVAKLVSVNDQPLSDADRQKDQTRLDALLADPNKQRKRKQSEQDDTARAMKVLRVLPRAFVYEYAGTTQNGAGNAEKFTFRPNPKFDPPDLETEVLTALTGEIWIDAAHERVIRLEGHLQQDVDFGWGILGRLNKGGSIRIEQEDVGEEQWRIVHFQMEMSGRVLIKTRVFDTSEEESQFAPVPTGMTYQQAIQLLRAGDQSGQTQGH
jgi:hypothetical protein